MHPDCVPGGPRRRLLVVNPNSNRVVTALIRAAADRVLAAGTEAVVVDPPDAPHSIETPLDRAAAEPRALALIEASPDFDAYVLACFDDIAVHAARGIVAAPVVSAIEASIAIARTLARRFAIVTTVEAAVPGIRALLETHGAAALCTVRAAGIGVAAATAARADAEALSRLRDAVVRAVAEDHAEAVILGSGGLTGCAAGLAASVSVPIIDSVEAALAMAEAAARSHRRMPR
jgi:allantoin racemase